MSLVLNHPHIRIHSELARTLAFGHNLSLLSRVLALPRYDINERCIGKYKAPLIVIARPLMLYRSQYTAESRRCMLPAHATLVYNDERLDLCRMLKGMRHFTNGAADSTPSTGGFGDVACGMKAHTHVYMG